MEPLTPRAREVLAAYRDEHALSPEARRRGLERLGAAHTLQRSEAEQPALPSTHRMRPRVLRWLVAGGVASLALVGGAIVTSRGDNHPPPVLPGAALATPVAPFDATPATTPDTPLAAPKSEPVKSAAVAPPRVDDELVAPVLARGRKRGMRREGGQRSAAPAAEEPTPMRAASAPARENESLRERSPAPAAARPMERDERSFVEERVSASSAAASRSLDSEVALLRRARELMTGGHPLRALAALEEHARLFPDGKLTDMRQVARIEALCELGRAQQAAQEAASFTQRHPDSAYAARARRGCSEP